MKSFKLSAILLLVLACDAKVGVTNGTGATAGLGPEEAQLQNVLIPRCRSICKAMSSCPSTCDCGESTSTSAPYPVTGAAGGEGSGDVASGGAAPVTPEGDGSDVCTCVSRDSFDDCFPNCVDVLATRFLNRGETCAAVGNDLVDCFNGLTCNDFQHLNSGDDRCGAESMMALCPDSDAVGVPSNAAPIDSSSYPGTAGGATGTSVGAGGSAGTSFVLPQVRCNTGMAGGKAPSTTPLGPNEELCDNERTECSDGHEYRVFCGTNADTLIKCYCVFDGKAQVAFDASVLGPGTDVYTICLNVDAINQQCGWSLTSN